MCIRDSATTEAPCPFRLAEVYYEYAQYSLEGGNDQKARKLIAKAAELEDPKVDKELLSEVSQLIADYSRYLPLRDGVELAIAEGHDDDALDTLDILIDIITVEFEGRYPKTRKFERLHPKARASDEWCPRTNKWRIADHILAFAGALQLGMGNIQEAAIRLGQIGCFRRESGGVYESLQASTFPLRRLFRRYLSFLKLVTPKAPTKP